MPEHPKWLAGLEQVGEGVYRDPETGLEVELWNVRAWVTAPRFAKLFWRVSGRDTLFAGVAMALVRGEALVEIRLCQCPPGEVEERIVAIQAAARLARAYNETGGQ